MNGVCDAVHFAVGANEATRQLRNYAEQVRSTHRMLSLGFCDKNTDVRCSVLYILLYYMLIRFLRLTTKNNSAATKLRSFNFPHSYTVQLVL